jgi:CHAD domain-containing protein
MGYRFRPKERIDAGIRRVVREQVRGAIADLTGPREERHEGVHEARKRFKMIRAVLRLARPSLGELQFALENSWYRDTGRRLSSVRDAVAMIECFDALEKRFAKDLAPGVAERARARLQSRLETVASEDAGLEGHCARVASGLKGAQARLRDWPIHDRGFKTIGPGLHRVYRQGRGGMEAALESPTDENHHEWRKRAKDHWYHVRLLRNSWPKVMDAYRREMRVLTEALGADHDLALLAPLLRNDADGFGGADATAVLLALVDRRRHELQEQARLVGRRIYAEKPRVLLDRFKARW